MLNETVYPRRRMKGPWRLRFRFYQLFMSTGILISCDSNDIQRSMREPPFYLTWSFQYGAAHIASVSASPVSWAVFAAISNAFNWFLSLRWQQLRPPMDQLGAGCWLFDVVFVTKILFSFLSLLRTLSLLQLVPWLSFLRNLARRCTTQADLF